MDKNILRSRMKKLRADIEPAVRENKDKAVYKNILSSGFLKMQSGCMFLSHMVQRQIQGCL